MPKTGGDSPGPDAGGFSLSGTDTGFKGRSKQVFDCLGTIAEKHEAFERAMDKLPDAESTSDTEEGDVLNEDTACVEPTSCKEDSFKTPVGLKEPGFKKPIGSAPKAKVVPGFEEEPARWQHYDLSDVECSTSNSANAAAAMEFLRSRKKSEEGDRKDEQDKTDSCSSKHVYQKPQKDNDLQTKTEQSESASVLSKGKKMPKSDAIVTISNTTKESKALHHLSACDEESSEKETDTAKPETSTNPVPKFGFKARKGQRSRGQNLRQREADSSDEEDDVDKTDPKTPPSKVFPIKGVDNDEHDEDSEGFDYKVDSDSGEDEQDGLT